MTDQNNVIVTARPGDNGWDLILGNDETTQVRSLSHAKEQVIEYLDTVEPDTDHSGLDIRLVPSEGAEQIEQARKARREAERAEAEAAEQIRQVVVDLRERRGYSLADTAALLGVSRARISQLVRSRRPAA